METTVKTEKPKKVKTGKKTSKVSDLSKIFGVAKGQIFYDESIFNFGKRKVTI